MGVGVLDICVACCVRLSTACVSCETCVVSESILSSSCEVCGSCVRECRRPSRENICDPLCGAKWSAQLISRAASRSRRVSKAIHRFEVVFAEIEVPVGSVLVASETIWWQIPRLVRRGERSRGLLCTAPCQTGRLVLVSLRTCVWAAYLSWSDARECVSVVRGEVEVVGWLCFDSIRFEVVYSDHRNIPNCRFNGVVERSSVGEN